MSRLIKKYYRIEFKLNSPLAVGSGENAETDKDIALDSRGLPYIPGSAMAGVYRRILTEDEANKYFGKLLVGTQELDESKVIVYDAVLKPEAKPYVSKRDMVALDEYKTAITGAKFDFQIVEPGETFVTWIEENLEPGDDGVSEQILAQWEKDGLSIGAKTRRGYGNIEWTRVDKWEFELPTDRDNWLSFDLYHAKTTEQTKYTPTKQPEIKRDNVMHIVLNLQQQGGISIREYNTDENEPVYRQMKLHKDKCKPVIPGTSWAGAFRAQMKKLGLEEAELKPYFGERSGSGAGQRSRISFSESQIEGGSDIIYTRNAIDRFTGGTIDGALYKESTHYNGTTKLEITLELPKEDEEKSNDRFLKTLAAAIMDLHNGYLAVGGLTAIGRGMFKINCMRVNENDVDVISYECMKKSFWC